MFFSDALEKWHIKSTAKLVKKWSPALPHHKVHRMFFVKLVGCRRRKSFLSNSHGDTKPQSFYLWLIIFSADKTDIRRFPPKKNFATWRLRAKKSTAKYGNACRHSRSLSNSFGNNSASVREFEKEPAPVPEKETRAF